MVLHRSQVAHFVVFVFFRECFGGDMIGSFSGTVSGVFLDVCVDCGNHKGDTFNGDIGEVTVVGGVVGQSSKSNGSTSCSSASFIILSNSTMADNCFSC